MKDLLFLPLKLATRIWALREGHEVVDFNGTWDEFTEKHADLVTRRV